MKETGNKKSCKVYAVAFSARGYVAIKDEAGEAAVYPSELFIPVSLPAEIAEVITHLQAA